MLSREPSSFLPIALSVILGACQPELGQNPLDGYNPTNTCLKAETVDTSPRTMYKAFGPNGHEGADQMKGVISGYASELAKAHDLSLCDDATASKKTLPIVIGMRIEADNIANNDQVDADSTFNVHIGRAGACDESVSYTWFDQTQQEYLRDAYLAIDASLACLDGYLAKND